jgi:hypothetical protein
MKSVVVWCVCGVLAVGAAACGEDGVAEPWQVREAPGDQTGYGDADAVVVVTDGAGNTTTYEVSGSGEGCVQVNAQTCVDINAERGRYCGDSGAQADIILNEAGEVTRVICYPPPSSGAPVEEVLVTQDGSVELPQNANGAVVVFGEQTNGEPIEGDTTLNAERVVIFGNGVDKTIFGGDLVLASNNARVRGVTIEGDLRAQSNSNNVSVSFCKVHGSLQVSGNSFTIANCQIFGDVNVTGNDATLLNIGVAGQWNPGRSACEGCYSFADANDDKIVQQSELGEALMCSRSPMPR